MVLNTEACVELHSLVHHVSQLLSRGDYRHVSWQMRVLVEDFNMQNQRKSWARTFVESFFATTHASKVGVLHKPAVVARGCFAWILVTQPWP